ncbi:hypothetical protein GGTG_13465 [Gaeumannomyces tritici R3-111a-1]|uniref:Uncharacterized protein n=1 Tax=Gaeumannomyces tritici (strain R3-111a-1) TaxID=644352 RepID=J3PIY5_GAET3|nr:hypothetical protein GGTG_13465 [Gaeumannomyces tritici R3-111a-1]EJT68959.1 hypothetical protein GGTG_13465 [Gaeumannomyces tritici R3-111a-1]
MERTRAYPGTEPFSPPHLGHRSDLEFVGSFSSAENEHLKGVKKSTAECVVVKICGFEAGHRWGALLTHCGTAWPLNPKHSTPEEKSNRESATYKPHPNTPELFLTR